MSYNDYDYDTYYKYVNNYDDGTNPPERIGCIPFIIGIIIIIFFSIAARSCGKDLNNPFGNDGYERSLID